MIYGGDSPFASSIFCFASTLSGRYVGSSSKQNSLFYSCVRLCIFRIISVVDFVLRQPPPRGAKRRELFAVQDRQDLN